MSPDQDRWQDPKPSEQEVALRKVRRAALLRGTVVGIVVLGVLVGAIANAPDSEPDRCAKAANSHLRQAEDAATAEERLSHAELALVYVAKADRGHKCSWWTP